MVEDFKDKPISLAFNWKLDRAYMTVAESIELKKLRDAGRLSFFRIKKCEHAGCDQEVINEPEKKWCSEAHMLAAIAVLTEKLGADDAKHH